MLATWLLLFGLAANAESFMLSGITSSLQIASDILPALLYQNHENDSFNQKVLPSIADSERTRNLVTELHTGNNSENQHQVRESVRSKPLVVFTRIGDYDEEFSIESWDNVTNSLRPSNKSLNVHGRNQTQQSQDNYLEKSDIQLQPYLNEFQELLYTFKDYVKLGEVPGIKEKSSKIAENAGSETTYNYTYTMRIPNTRKFFEINFPNLTKAQYNEINALVQEHFRKKSNSSLDSGRKEEVVKVEVDNRKHLESRALSGSSPLLRQMGEIATSQNNFPSNYHQTMTFFYDQFSPDVIQPYLSNSDTSSSSELNSTKPPLGQSTVAPLLRNNGFHAEIATDYVSKQEGNSLRDAVNESSLPINLMSSRRNRTKLYPQTRLKRPIVNAPNIVAHRRAYPYPNINGGSDHGQLPLTFPASFHSFRPNSSSTSIEKTANGDKSTEITNDSTNKTKKISNHEENLELRTETTTKSQELTEILLFNSSPTETIQFVPNKEEQTALLLAQKSNNMSFNMAPQHLVQAAKWLINMKNRMEDEEAKKIERYKSVIKKDFLEREESFNRSREEGNVMKINKQENILEEIKFQMLNYFIALNLNISDGNHSGVESILNTTNLFELMDESTKFVKRNLQMKIKVENKELEGFLKKVSDKQSEKCLNFINSRMIKNKTEEQLKKTKTRRLMAYTKCFHRKTKNCVFGFSVWLQKRKYQLRPHFKASRAFESYEIERNLYCLRSYNPSLLSSNRLSVKVKPGTKINRKFGAGKTRSGQNRAMYRMRKTGNRQQQGKEARGRSSLGRRRTYNPENTRVRPSVQRYTDKKRVTSVVHQQRKDKQKTMENPDSTR